MASQRPNPKIIGAGVLTLALAISTQFEWNPNSHKDHVGFADPIATSHVATACMGHTGKDVIVGKFYDDEQCNVWAKADETSAYACVQQSFTLKLSDKQLAAITDFTLNEGCGNLRASQFLREANAHQPASVWCPHLLHFNVSGGQVRSGLTRRRQDEIKLCLEK